jgi:hypothetical protein
MKEEKSLEGIIPYLSNIHAGNVHEKVIVTVASKSTNPNPAYGLQNVADATTWSSFQSETENLIVQTVDLFEFNSDEA